MYKTYKKREASLFITDLRVLEAIRNYKLAHDGNSPTLSDLSKTLKMVKSNVLYCVRKLENAGLLKVDHCPKRLGFILLGGRYTYIRPKELDTLDPRQGKLPI